MILDIRLNFQEHLTNTLSKTIKNAKLLRSLKTLYL